MLCFGKESFIATNCKLVFCEAVLLCFNIPHFVCAELVQNKHRILSGMMSAILMTHGPISEVVKPICVFEKTLIAHFPLAKQSAGCDYSARRKTWKQNSKTVALG